MLPWRSATVGDDEHGVDMGEGQLYVVEASYRQAGEGHKPCGPRQEAAVAGQLRPGSEEGRVVAHHHHHHTPRHPPHLWTIRHSVSSRLEDHAVAA